MNSLKHAVTAAFLLVVAPAIACCQVQALKQLQTSSLHRLDPRTPKDLQELFRYSPQTLPLVSAHRGGAQKGFPENCIPTFENTLQQTFAMLEIDPRYTKDKQIVVHHDATLERTTTGRGKLTDFTWEELKPLRLKDPAGNSTEFPIPTLDEVLEWARGKTVLVLDQKDVPVAERVKKVAGHKAESYAMLIVYSFQDAKACYDLNPQIMMEVMIPSREKVAEFDKLGVPWNNVIAFVGHHPPEDLELYKLIHDRGACCLIGTSRNLDKKFLNGEVETIQALEADYRAYLKRGADLIETDIPAALGPMLYGKTLAPDERKKYFVGPTRK
jgi:glycerophosphoryl diester phosphodiesterase